MEKIFHASNSTQYWIFNFLLILDLPTTYINTYDNRRNFSKRFLKKKENNLPIKFRFKQKFFNLKYNLNSPEYFLNEKKKKINLSFFKPRIKVNNRVYFSKNLSKKIFFNLKTKNKFDIFAINRLYGNLNVNKGDIVDLTINKGLFFNLFDINFLRKERMYTKLKYSRVPQYDIVSGASAALLAGFLGFLVCEKFGFELPDSGDFYFLFMYGVFFSFLSRMLLKLATYQQEGYFLLSFKFFLNFYKNLNFIFLSFFKNFFKINK